MKHLQMMGLMASAALLVGCANDEQIGRTGQKEQANRRVAQQQLGQVNETQDNLQNAQRDLVNRDGNPMRQGYNY
jgi:hypothetical protein